MPILKTLTITSLIVILSACGATTQTATPPDKPLPTVTVSEVEETVAVLPKSSETEETALTPSPAVSEPEEAALASLPTASEPEGASLIPLPKVGVLMGKTTQEIEAVFGSPVLLRKDKPAEVWQYLTKDCALHLTFYPTTKVSSDSLTVQHISMNDRHKVIVVDSEACFGSQLRRVGEDRAQALS
ncbi:MAG: hypothetical protein V7750_03065 [Sneathiella sp.]